MKESCPSYHKKHLHAGSLENEKGRESDLGFGCPEIDHHVHIEFLRQ